MNFIGWIFPIILISVIFNVVSKAAKQVNKQQQQNQAQGIRPDMQQSLRQQVAAHQNTTAQSSGMSRAPLESPELAREGAPLNRYSYEGAELNRSTLEGVTLEGISLENAKSPDRITPTIETDNSLYESRRQTDKDANIGNAFINSRSIINGVIMSEVLSSRGGRKRTR